MPDIENWKTIALGRGDKNEPAENCALRDRLGADAMNVLKGLSEIASALAGIIKPGNGIAVYVEPDDGGDELSVRVIGVKPIKQK